MSRKPRRKSRGGIYHIMLRGINRQTIFEDERDKYRLLETIEKFKEKSNFELYSYCFMDNHIHLLLKETEEPVSLIIKRISASYVYWYNNRYERCGHLFQDRFKSEAVETIPYFLTVLRYIHQNPLKAQIATNVFECRWTSIKEYLGNSSIVDIDFALNLLSSDRNKALQIFNKYMQEVNGDQCLDDYVKVKLSDDEVREHLLEIGVPQSVHLQQMKKLDRDAILIKLRNLNGVSYQQLSRITGISKSVIARAK
jgi:putative transposase